MRYDESPRLCLPARSGSVPSTLPHTHCNPQRPPCFATSNSNVTSLVQLRVVHVQVSTSEDRPSLLMEEPAGDGETTAVTRSPQEISLVVNCHDFGDTQQSLRDARGGHTPPQQARAPRWHSGPHLLLCVCYFVPVSDLETASSARASKETYSCSATTRDLIWHGNRSLCMFVCKVFLVFQL